MKTIRELFLAEEITIKRVFIRTRRTLWRKKSGYSHFHRRSGRKGLNMKRQAHPMVRRSQKEMRMSPKSERLVTTGLNGSTIIKTVKGNRVVYEAGPERLKERANQLYNQGKYSAAVSEYSMLIGLHPNNEIYYGNRAACYLMMNNYEKALKDARKSVEINPNFIKGHSRVIKCAMALHELTDMSLSVAKLRQIDPTNEILKFHSEKMLYLTSYIQNHRDAVAGKKYSTALFYITKCLEICPEFVDYKLKKAECFIHLRQLNEAEKIANDVLNQNRNIGEAHHVLGTCFYQTDIQKSVDSFREAFRLCPDSVKDRELFQKGTSFLNKKTDGNNAYKSHDYTKAYECYLDALRIDPQNKIMLVTLYFNMAQASYKLGFPERCIQECGRTLAINANHVKALMRRSQCYMDQRNYEEAIEDLERAERIDSSADIRRMLQEARRLLERSKNDFCGILGVSERATMQEATKAYRELARIHHPDRHANATDAVKKYHEMKCKEITRAYRLLKEQKGWNYCSNNNNNFNSQKKPSTPPTQPEPQQTSGHEDPETEDDASRFSRDCEFCGGYVSEDEECDCQNDYWDGTESQDGYYDDGYWDDYY